MKGSLIILVVLMGLVALFTFQNPDVVTVRFFSLAWNTSVLAVIVASFAVGLLGGWLAAIPRYFRRRAQAAEEKKIRRALEAEVASLQAEIARLKPAADMQSGFSNPEETA